MKHTHITHWVLGTLGAIMIISATASFAQDSGGLSASVLDSVVSEPQITPLAPLPTAVISNDIQSSATPESPIVTTKKTIISGPVQIQTTPLECSFGTTPVVENGRLVGCEVRKEIVISSKQLETTFATPTKTNKIKIPEQTATSTASRASCESKGLFTYTGEDVPGMLYGTCIPCEMNNFITQSRTCKK
ncbi:hypothetical protein KBD59_00495 [Candidatus Gracilibacteria bacterium]|nr:hypothetical protein [Candidatus Gracilibacteria bacterium]